MTDLSRILPDFPLGQYARLLPAIEKQSLTTTDLLTLSVPDIGKRTGLSLLDIKRLCNAVLELLHVDLGVSTASSSSPSSSPAPGIEGKRRSRDERITSSLKQTGAALFSKQWHAISTLDPALDRALGGGIPTGYVTEITGESGAGKTQFLLTLLLAVQLPPPHGLGRPALYISTEAPLSTRRLSQMLTHHPFFRRLKEKKKEQRQEGREDDDGDEGEVEVQLPSLDRIISTVTPDLESQDHILNYQVPVEVERRNVGLLVLDSVAANYRAEFERGASASGSNMAARSNDLVRLGQLLHDLARRYDLAVVVSNQVADRFTNSDSGLKSASITTMTTPAAFVTKSNEGPTPSSSTHQHHLYLPVSQESPLASRSRGAIPLSADNNNLYHHQQQPRKSSSGSVPSEYVQQRSSMPEPSSDDAAAPAALLLDHQQRWFTGWGDNDLSSSSTSSLKTPSLGLVWSTQISSRIALFRRPVYGRRPVLEEENELVGNATLKTWRRWMKVVFAPHVPGTGQGLDGAVEFEITMGGVRGVEQKRKKR